MPAPQQEAWLRWLSIPVPVDELGLELDDGYLLLPQWMQAGWLPTEAAAAFAAVDRALTDMSGQEHSDLWTVEALRSAAPWAEVRLLASQVLHALKPVVRHGRAEPEKRHGRAEPEKRHGRAEPEKRHGRAEPEKRHGRAEPEKRHGRASARRAACPGVHPQ